MRLTYSSLEFAIDRCESNKSKLLDLFECVKHLFANITRWNLTFEILVDILFDRVNDLANRVFADRSFVRPKVGSWASPSTPITL